MEITEDKKFKKSIWLPKSLKIDANIEAAKKELDLNSFIILAIRNEVERLKA